MYTFFFLLFTLPRNIILEDFDIQSFRTEIQDHNLSMGTERESSRFGQAEQFILEYWSHSRQTLNVYINFSEL